MRPKGQGYASGLVRSVLLLLGADSPAPHYSTLSRRAATLEVKLPRLSKGALHLAVDSTGVKLNGEGEWKVRLHGAEKRRTWRKLHLLIDLRFFRSGDTGNRLGGTATARNGIYSTRAGDKDGGY